MLMALIVISILYASRNIQYLITFEDIAGNLSIINGKYLFLMEYEVNFSYLIEHVNAIVLNSLTSCEGNLLRLEVA